MRFFVLLLFGLFLHAQENYSLKFGYGEATKSDFAEILVGNMGKHAGNYSLFTLDGGYLWLRDFNEYPVDVYLRGGLSYYNERSNGDVVEATAYVKALWNFYPYGNQFRIGFGEGLSYTSDILYVEWLEAYEENGKNSKFLNYLDVSVDMNVGKFINLKSMQNSYIGWTLKHRSGIFGLINNVRRGGSNYNLVTLEAKF